MRYWQRCSRQFQIANALIGAFSLELIQYLHKTIMFIKMIYSLRHYLEKRGFYVSSRLADRLGMRAKNVRLFFIYVSFFTVGAGFAIYLTLAFILKLKDLVYTKRTSVFDL